MFWDVLDDERKRVLRLLVATPPIGGAYLAGGTGLALLFGHRTSVDFDWFTPDDFSPAALASRLGELGPLRVAETAPGTFHGWLGQCRVTWLRYTYPMLRPFVTPDDLPGLSIASPLDIALMKWTALSDRGALKDFIDLYECARQGLPLRLLHDRLGEKFPGLNLNRYHMIKCLTYFDDAKSDPWPEIRRSVTWGDLEAYFRTAGAELLRSVSS